MAKRFFSVACLFVLFVPCLLAQEGDQNYEGDQEEDQGDQKFEPDEDLGEGAALPPRQKQPTGRSKWVGDHFESLPEPDENENEDHTAETYEGNGYAGEKFDAPTGYKGASASSASMNEDNVDEEDMYKHGDRGPLSAEEKSAEAAKQQTEKQWKKESDEKARVEKEVEKMRSEIESTEDNNLKGLMDLQRQATEGNNDLSQLDIQAQQDAAAKMQQEQFAAQHPVVGKYSSQPFPEYTRGQRGGMGALLHQRQEKGSNTAMFFVVIAFVCGAGMLHMYNENQNHVGYETIGSEGAGSAGGANSQIPMNL
jgi:hypothetical protein